jgi:hypothetical protein
MLLFFRTVPPGNVTIIDCQQLANSLQLDYDVDAGTYPLSYIALQYAAPAAPQQFWTLISLKTVVLMVCLSLILLN